MTIQGTSLGISCHRNQIYWDSHNLNVPFISHVARNVVLLNTVIFLVLLVTLSSIATQANYSIWPNLRSKGGGQTFFD